MILTSLCMMIFGSAVNETEVAELFSLWRRLAVCRSAGWQPAERPFVRDPTDQSGSLRAASPRHSRLPVCAT
jgi:hypothetical protein